MLSATISWVGLSSALVASSKKTIRGRDTSARAIMIRCRWPPDRVLVPSDIPVCMPIGIALISSSIPAIRAAAQASSRV